VNAAETLAEVAERIALEATTTRVAAHESCSPAAREALLLAADELMASAPRLRIVAAQEEAARRRERRRRGVRELDGVVKVG
jgi:hypothetical protein